MSGVNIFMLGGVGCNMIDSGSPGNIHPRHWRYNEAKQRPFNKLLETRECPDAESGPGVWGCPPNLIYPPFLARKGERGMVETVIKHSPKYNPHPQAEASSGRQLYGWGGTALVI